MSLLTMRDLTDSENVKDAIHQLGMAEARGDCALASWARDWGRPALDVLRETADDTEEADSTKSLNAALDQVDDLSDGITEALKFAENLADNVPEAEWPAGLQTLIEKLEALEVDVAKIDGATQ